MPNWNREDPPKTAEDIYNRPLFVRRDGSKFRPRYSVFGFTRQELPKEEGIYFDKNGIKDGREGRGIGGLLRGDFVKRGEFLYWQSKLNEHLDKSKKPKSIWTNDGHGMDKV